MSQGIKEALGVERIRAEYLEIPGLTLTEGQAARLLGLDPSTTAAALQSLESDGFLLRTRGNQFVRGDTLLRRRDALTGRSF